MFNRDNLFSTKGTAPGRDARQPAVAPGQPFAAATPRPAQPEPPRADTAPPAAVPAQKSDGKGSRLIVGPDIKLKGAEITDCDTLVVEGRVEASMDSRVIQIAEQGVFSGTAGIDIAEIHGRFEGELTARKQLVIRATGKVTGKVRYGKLTIEEGGELSGDVGSLESAEQLRRDRPPAPRPATANH